MSRRFSLATFALASLVAALPLAGCDKPTDDDCRKAIVNIQHLQGTDNVITPSDLESEVRRCRGGSSKEAVACAIKAGSLDDLHACAFYKPAKSSDGSNAGSAGSAK